MFTRKFEVLVTFTDNTYEKLEVNAAGQKEAFKEIKKELTFLGLEKEGIRHIEFI